VFFILQELDHPVDHLGLSVGSNLAIARKCRQYLLVPQVLAPP
jgi:hypothetical protein